MHLDHDQKLGLCPEMPGEMSRVQIPVSYLRLQVWHRRTGATEIPNTLFFRLTFVERSFEYCTLLCILIQKLR